MQKINKPVVSESDSYSSNDFDPAKRLSDFNHEYARIIRALMNVPKSTDLVQFSFRIGCLFNKAVLSSSTDLQKLSKLHWSAVAKYMELGSYIVQKTLGNDAASAVQPKDDDGRFKFPQWHAEAGAKPESLWNGTLWFDTLKQSYLINTDLLRKFFDQPHGLSDQETRKLKFYIEQVLDAMSPTNFPSTNPEVLQAIRETKGENLIQGLRNFADDLESGPAISMVDTTAFQLGHNIAATPGKVIARNRMAELIQYTPSTETVHSRPIMIVPPWINKYYILDLSPKNSFIHWLVGQGYTVFVISWVNPDDSYRNTSFDDYLKDGPLWAMQVMQSITGQRKINAIGYCLGGTLLATALGYLESKDGNLVEISSATFFASMIDFAEPGDLGVFVDEQSVSELESKMQDCGYLDGKSMASTFSMMRANDLIWHFVINNYLLGKAPAKFDLLYWNSDSTRLPAKMHSFYLRKMYLENKLAEPNGLCVLDTALDLSKVQCPTTFISTETDHIAPWCSTYSGAKLLSGRVQFILGQSGHIAGIINSPHRQKYGYWSNSKPLPESADEWLESAEYTAGSWWPAWERWLRRHSGKKIAAPTLGNESYPPLMDAPGKYVKL